MVVFFIFLIMVIFCALVIVKNYKKICYKACGIFNEAKSIWDKFLESDKGGKKQKNNIESEFVLNELWKLLSWDYRCIRYFFAFCICMIILFAFIGILNVYSFLLFFLAYILLFLGLASVIETGVRWTNDIFKLVIIIIESFLISLMCALNIFSKELEEEQFRFSFFIVMMIILVGALILSIYQVNTMNSFKFISFLIISVFSVVIVILFYSYVGYGLIILEVGKGESLRNSVLNVKGFGTNGWRDTISIMYYGLSQVNSWPGLEIQHKNQMKPVITNNAIIIHLIANLFNLVYFSSIINALSNFFKKKR